MSTVKLTYDHDQHGIVLKEPQNKRVAIGCTHNIEGEINELSAGDLVAAGVAGCMLFSMGVLARREKIDILGTVVDIAFSVTENPFPHMDSISLVFNIPHHFSPEERHKLEQAAGKCPLKASFREETAITSEFKYA